jgi:hypothetical protein
MERTTKSRTISQISMTHEGRHANDRLLFGRPLKTAKLSSKNTLHSFEPDQIFGFVRWRGDKYGTQTWRVIVAQAGCAGERLTRIPGIQPGAHLLLHAFGKTRAKRALRVIDLLSEAHVLHEIAPSYWRHVHLQLSRNLEPEPYDPDAFAALARAKAVT